MAPDLWRIKRTLRLLFSFFFLYFSPSLAGSQPWLWGLRLSASLPHVQSPWKVNPGSHPSCVMTCDDNKIHHQFSFCSEPLIDPRHVSSKVGGIAILGHGSPPVMIMGTMRHAICSTYPLPSKFEWGSLCFHLHTSWGRTSRPRSDSSAVPGSITETLT
jgi:hypothetical protein